MENLDKKKINPAISRPAQVGKLNKCHLQELVEEYVLMSKNMATPPPPAQAGAFRVQQGKRRAPGSL